MIVFVTVLLGLVVGSHTVQMNVAGPVTEIEVVLDGELIERLTAEPWQLRCDFGPVLRPHQLTAIARNAEGRELSRVSQMINVGQSQAKASWGFEVGDDGWPEEVDLFWESVGQRHPRSMEVTFDGEPVELPDGGLIPIPPHDRAVSHFMKAEIAFSDTEVLTLQAAFGGLFGDEVRTDLSAIVVVVPDGVKPQAQEMQSWFHKKGQSLRVVAVEQGPVEVVVVGHPDAQQRFDLMDAWQDKRTELQQSENELEEPGSWEQLVSQASLSFFSPLAAPCSSSAIGSDLFPQSAVWPLDRSDGFLGALQRAGTARHPVRLADAVALAGLAAYKRQHRRAVILMIDGNHEDGGRHTSDEVQEFLRLLQVPLEVWSVSDDGALSLWGEVQQVGRDRIPMSETDPGWTDSDFGRAVENLDDAVKNLGRRLERQWVVWLEGGHTASQISIAEEAGIRFAAASSGSTSG
ncbi:MAG: hypothetical protein GY906_18465 [bacterium]|nr:hypothetical protein [bacterium]